QAHVTAIERGSAATRSARGRGRRKHTGARLVAPRGAAARLGLRVPPMSVGGGDRLLLEHPFAVDLPPGGEIVVRGAVRSSFDGAVFDAATRIDVLPDGSSLDRPGGLFDLEAGGLRVASIDTTTHEVHLVASGGDAPTCTALGLGGACLVPRTEVLAHERLM